MQFVWPFDSNSHRSSSYKSQLPSTPEKSFKHNYKFDLNTNNSNNFTEIMDFISLLPPIIQLLIITLLLIASLLLYEADINQTNIFIFIIFRSIAFIGIIIDVYLFLKLIPLHTQDENNKKPIRSFNPIYKAYHTPSYQQINISNKCNSAPPILNTLYPINKPINKLFTPSPSNSPYINIPQHHAPNPYMANISETIAPQAIAPTSEHTNTNIQQGEYESQPMAIPWPSQPENISNPKEEKSASVVSNNHNTNYVCNERMELMREMSGDNYSISSHSSDDNILDNYCINTTYGDRFEYNKPVNLGSNRIQVPIPSQLLCQNIDVINNNINNNSNNTNNIITLKPKIQRRKTTNKQRQKVMLQKRKEMEKLFYNPQTNNKKVKVNKYNENKMNTNAKRRRTRIDLENKTKMKIVNHYLKYKKRNRNYNSNECKLYFNDKNINCGRNKNITKWTREKNIIKENIKRFGPKKRRNRERKSWFHKMENELNECIEKEEEKINGKVSNKWVKEKAMQLHKQLYPNRDFKASNGWLSNFEKRYK